MKCVLLSVKPQWVAKILNKEKIIEVRKKFPKEYVGWVYIYCTKDKTTTINLKTLLFGNPKNAIRNGKVVCRFWCDKVEEIEYYEDNCSGYSDDYECGYQTESMTNCELYKKSCLTDDEMDKYLQGENGYAIHINNLEIFDKPKEISEFWNNGKKVKGHNGTYQYSKLTRAPQSFCFIEV